MVLPRFLLHRGYFEPQRQAYTVTNPKKVLLLWHGAWATKQRFIQGSEELLIVFPSGSLLVIR